MVVKENRQHIVLGLRVLVAIVLIVAAVLKWRAFGSANGSPLSAAAPQLEWLIIQLELITGIWLLSNWLLNAAWAMTTFLFGGFSAAALIMVANGRSSCGCLGTVEVNPVWFLIFDLAVLTALCCFRPSLDVPLARKPFLSVGSFFWAICLILGLSLGATVNYHAGWISSVSNVFPASLTGQYLLCQPAVARAENGPPGVWREVSFSINNRSDDTVVLYGAENNCSCRAVNSLPISIPAKQSKAVNFKVKLGKTEGVQQARFWVLTSHKNQRTLLCRWQASVVAAPKSSSSKIVAQLGFNN